jgi:signal transduction histidine kinase
VSLTVSPVRDRDGRIVGAAKIVRDVTAEREAAREREKTRDLLLGSLSHDLRNPLNTINVSVHTLKHNATAPDQKALERISNSTERMLRMIDQLLDFTESRLGGGIPIHPQDTDLAAICRTVADEFEALYPGRIRLKADGEVSGRWDGDRLTDVLSNLVSNAFRYGSAQDPVAISVGRRDGFVLLEVTNRGPTIPASLLPVIFDPFQRGPVEQHRGIRGLGLGLYIAREIVRAHHGEIAVSSCPVEGTTFSVSLPRSSEGSSSGSGA